MKDLLTLGQMLSVHARLSPDRLGASDLERRMTFREWNGRACRLANGLLGLGLAKGARVGVLAYNCVEWAEIYVAAAKSGLVAVPVNFRLVGGEVAFILNNAEVSAVIVQDELAGVIEEVRSEIGVPERNFVHFGRKPAPRGFTDYEALIAASSSSEPSVSVAADDPWMLMYTSGTTGNPKGAIRSHRGGSALSLCTEIELGVHRNDGSLLVMPMCHANSLYFFGAFAYCGAATNIYSRKNFDPEHALKTLADTRSSFTSLVPTHYIMMLALEEAVRGRYDLSNVQKLMISSAPARPETKREVMELFQNSGLFELYGSTETGWVTMLHPHEQFDKLGSVGRECVGSSPIRLLGDDGEEVPDGEPGELFANNPYIFDGYWKLPEKTAAAFRGDYCTVGDIARRDPDGFIQLVDRKSNMIISGGENVYPSEVETAIGAHPKVQDVAVVGLPDPKWGESVHAAVVPHASASITEAELQGWCKERLAGYKRPRGFSFFRAEDMPRNATGKVLYRVLKTQLLQKERDDGGDKLSA